MNYSRYPMYSFSQVEQSNSDDNLLMRIPVSKRSDTGKYTVKVRNENGEESHDINVNVLGQ